MRPVLMLSIAACASLAASSRRCSRSRSVSRVVSAKTEATCTSGTGLVGSAAMAFLPRLDDLFPVVRPGRRGSSRARTACPSSRCWDTSRRTRRPPPPFPRDPSWRKHPGRPSFHPAILPAARDCRRWEAVSARCPAPLALSCFAPGPVHFGSELGLSGLPGPSPCSRPAAPPELSNSISFPCPF